MTHIVWRAPAPSAGERLIRYACPPLSATAAIAAPVALANRPARPPSQH